MVFKLVWYHVPVVRDRVLLPQIYFLSGFCLPTQWHPLVRQQDGQLPRSRCHPEERLCARLVILTMEIRTPDEPVSQQWR
jgi:hypothetical protein